LSAVLIENALLFDGCQVHPRADLLIEDERVAGIWPLDAGAAGDPEQHAGTGARREPAPDPAPDPALAAARETARALDAGGRLVTPGLVNAHTHIYSTLACGIGLKEAPPESFPQILQRLWWRLDRALDLETIALSAHIHALDCARCGVTTIFDHHASQRVIDGSLRTIAEAVDRIGLRACLCFEVSDRDGQKAAAAGIAENVAMIRQAAADRSGRLRALFGLHASMTLSTRTLNACRDAHDRHPVGFHVHVAEDSADQRDAERRYHMRVVERLAQAGVLGPRTLCVHGVHLDPLEMEILGRSRSYLAHCPQSNMNNAVGVLRLAGLARLGVRLVLGTDGFSADMCRENLAAHLLQNHLAGDPREAYAAVPGLLLQANAGLAAALFEQPLGRLATGHPADLVVWDYLPATPLSEENLYGHLLFGLVGARARDLFVAGRQILAAGEPVGIDEAGLRRQARARTRDLWERF